MKLYLVILILILFCLAISAIEIPFSSQPIKTDANLFENFVRIDPDDKKPEILPTKAWLWYDEENFYVRYEARVDSTFIKGEYAPKDYGSTSDLLRIQLITIPEAYYAYLYIAYPTGSLQDGIRTSDMNVDFQWNSTYSLTTEYNDSLWTAVMKIPFKDMRFNAKPPYKWKIIFTRYNQKNEEFYSCPYANTKELKKYFSQSLDITLTHQIKRSSDWKFRPYFVKSYDLLEKKETYDPEHVGMDISFNPSTKTKLKVALNPDFSDVPPDDAQNNYNDKYPPIYDENRFFFTEDIDAFGVDYSMFYTRYIAQPQIAVKLTGNNKTLNYGYLCAKDKKIMDDGYVINDDDFFQLASIIKTLPKFQVVLSTASRINTGYYNHIGVGYWDWEFKKNLHFGTSHMYSIKHRDYPAPDEDDDKQGALFNTRFKANPGNWNIQAKYSNVQRDLRVDMGTYWDNGYENYDLSATWNSDAKEKTLRNWGFYSGAAYSNHLDTNRSFSYANVSASSWFNFLSKFNLTLGGNCRREAYESIEHDLFYTNGGCSLYKWDKFSINVNGGCGRYLIYSLNKTSYTTNETVYLAGSVGQKFNWSMNLTNYQYDYNRINYIGIDSSIVVLDNNYQIGSAYLNYNFNNSMTWRNGLSTTTYDANGAYANLSFYSNYRYEFRKDWFVYLGYQTGQYQDEKSVYHDPLGHFVRNTSSAYLKASLTI